MPLMKESLNVLGDALACCCRDPLTGFYRDGHCNTGPEDRGLHTVCAKMTTEFLQFSQQQGNDLMTPRPEYGFVGLADGDKWCLCLGRWIEALEAGKAPFLYLKGTHISVLEHVSLEILYQYALDEEKPVLH